MSTNIGLRLSQFARAAVALGLLSLLLVAQSPSVTRATTIGSTGQLGVTAFDPDISINDFGEVAAIASVNVAGQSATNVFVGDGTPGSFRNISPQVSPNESIGPGIQVNNQGLVVVRRQTSTLGIPVSYIETWDVSGVNQRTTRVFGQPLLGSFDGLYGFPSLSNVGGLVFTAFDQSQNKLGTVTSSGAFQVSFNNVLPHPQMADDNTFVLRLAGSRIVVMPPAFSPNETIAGSSGGFGLFGNEPGISDDGAVVGFTADRGSGPGVFVSVPFMSGRAVFRAAGEGADGFSAFDGTQRIGVTTTKSSGTLNLVTAVFHGVNNGVTGIWAVNLQPITGVPLMCICHAAIPVVTVGAVLGSRTVASVHVHDPVNNRGEVAVHASFTNGTESILRIAAGNPDDEELIQWTTECFNCYDYATNRKTDPWSQLGAFTCSTALDAAFNNGIIPAPWPRPSAGPMPQGWPAGQCPFGYSLAALVVAPGEDFHFYRLNGDGSLTRPWLWSHKMAETRAKFVDESRPGIPMTVANSPHLANLGIYSFCSYICVPNPPTVLPNTQGTGSANCAGLQGPTSIARRIAYSGRIGETVPLTPALLAQAATHLPTGGALSNVTWDVSVLRGEVSLLLATSASGFPPVLTVYDGVVKFSDAAGSFTYYQDNNGMEQWLASLFGAPSITGLSPSGVAMLNGQSTPPIITVTGTGFRGNSDVFVDGERMSSTVVSPTLMTFALDPARAQRRGAVAITVRNSRLNVSNTLALTVGGPASNQGTIRRAPLDAQPGEVYTFVIEDGAPGLPFTFIADQQPSAPIWPWPNMVGDMVLDVALQNPGWLWAPLLDGIGVYGPAQPAARFDAQGRFQGPGITLPSPSLGLQFTLQAGFIDPGSPLGYRLTWSRFPEAL